MQASVKHASAADQLARPGCGRAGSGNRAVVALEGDQRAIGLGGEARGGEVEPAQRLEVLAQPLRYGGAVRLLAFRR